MGLRDAEMAFPPGGILLVSSNGPFRLLLAYLERCSGVRKGTTELSLPSSPRRWPRNEATCTKLQDKHSSVLVYLTIKGIF